MDVLPRTPVLPRPAGHPGPPRRLSGHPRLSVVIVNYLHWDDTARLIRRLRDSRAVRDGDAEIVVVDNHSPPHRLIGKLRRAPGVSLRRWRANRGFARAVNEGCRLSRGDWFLLLNPDTSVPPGFLDQVLARLGHLDDRAGVVGYQIRADDGSPQPSTGRFPSLTSTLTRLLLPRRLRKYTAPDRPGLCEVDWVTGCCLLVRRQCLAAVDGLDGDYFLYYEDVDLCRRARDAGWSVWFDPAATVVHHRPLHSRAVPAHLRLITRHALLTYAGKHWPRWQAVALAGIVAVETRLRRLLAWAHGDAPAGRVFADLEAITNDLLRGRTAEARQRLAAVVRRQEQARAEAVDRRPVPQPGGPAAAVPDQRPAARPR